MIESLQALFLTDDRARWHAILWSWLAATVAGAVFAATNMNDQNLALIGLMASFSVFIYRFIVYHGARVKSISSLRRTASTAQIEEAITTDLRVRRRVFTELPLGAAAAALFGIVEQAMSSPLAVHAAAAEEFNNALKNGNAGATERISAVGDRVQKLLDNPSVSVPTRSRLVEDYVKIKAASLLNNGIGDYGGNPIDFDPPVPGEAMWNFLANGRTGFADAKFVSSNPKNRLATFHPSSIPIFASCMIKGFTQDTAGLILINDTFINCTIIYNAGKLFVANVQFQDCTVHIGENVPPAIRSALLSSGPISVTSDIPAAR